MEKQADGQSVVDSIAQDDITESVEIIAVGNDDAKSSNAVESLENLEVLLELKRIEEEKAAAQIELDKHSKGFEITKSGLRLSNYPEMVLELLQKKIILYQFITKGN